MNKVFFIGFAVFLSAFSAQATQADMRVECKLSGQSDARTSSPRAVRLEDFDAQWIFAEDKREILAAAVEMKTDDVIAVSHAGIVAGREASFQYTFHVGGCDGSEKTTATLLTKSIGVSDGGHDASQATSVYDCTCSTN